MTGRAVTAAAVVVGAVLGLLGCGVPTQDAATPLEVESLQPSPPRPADSVGTDQSRLWFVDGDRLVEQAGEAGAATVGDLLQQLATGPPDDATATVRSLLTDPAHGGTLLSLPSPEAAAAPAGQVTLLATEAFGSLPADEQVLLIGQVVLTLSAAGAESVQIVDPNGVPLAVPLPDGRLLDGPAKAADYAALALPPP